MVMLPSPEPIPDAGVWPPDRSPGHPVSSKLQKRLWFTLCALIVYRVGTFIPIPGIDPVVFGDIFAQQAGILGKADLFSGGALGRMTIFALGVMPFITSAIIMELITAVSPKLKQLKKESETGRQKIGQYTRYGTILLAAVQGYGIAVGIEGMSSSQGPAVIDPGLFFRATTAITLVGGTIFLMWLGEQITARGVGNGIFLIIFSGIVAHLPGAIAVTVELGRTGMLSPLQIAGLIAVVAFTIIVIVVVERAERRIIVVQYPKHQVGGRMFGGKSSYLALKINTAGIIPPILTSAIFLMLVTFLGRGSPIFMILYGALIMFFAFFYTDVAFNPKETADNLTKHGGNIPGIRPGKDTANFLDYILTRLTAVGALYLALISLLPEFLLSRIGVPFYFTMSLLIVVIVTMDTVALILEALKWEANHTCP